jgi:hypothetical protein
MSKSLQRIKARDLRKTGFGIKIIAKLCKVSSSTVSIWCSDIRLTADQIKQLENRAHDPRYGERLEYTQKQHQEKIKKIETLFHEGVSDISDINNRELFLIGIALYWAEGFKKDNLVGFSNSDPRMIKLFIKWLRDCCNLTQDRIKLRLGLNEQYKDKTKDIEQFWSNNLIIPITQFQKPFYQKVRWKKIYDHPEEYHGVLRVRVSKSTDLLRKIHGWIEGLSMSQNKRVYDNFPISEVGEVDR